MIRDLTNILAHQLQFEDSYLSSFSAKSSKSLGRKRAEVFCPIRTEFQRDRDRIIHSKAFRRLKHKTQVFISPKGDHYRTRLTHALEVSQISRTIARAIRVNEDLTEAIALGHDLGHTPFGHKGEEVLDELMTEGFRHNEQSVRVVSVIEDLNLTMETIDGIANHTGDVKPFTIEGQIVKIADRIAYLNHDIDDAIRAGIINAGDIPANCINLLGANTNERITSMVIDIIQNSTDKEEIFMSDSIQESMNELRQWMFNNVYMNSPAKEEEYKARRIISELYKYYMENPQSIEKISENYEESSERLVADYIAGMTDRFAIEKYIEIFIPVSWNKENYNPL
jgi:dGTPase